MAGDIGIRESVVILGPNEASQFDESFGPIRPEAGVLHRYGPRVMIGEIPESGPEVLRQALPQTLVHDESEEVADPAELDLDPLGSIGLSAFALRQSAEYAEAKAQRPLDKEPWDTPEATALDATGGRPTAPADRPAPLASTSDRLIGEVAVGIVIVSGPTPELQFSEAEVVEIVAEVQNGLGWLGSRSYGGGVTWYYDLQQVSIAAQPNPSAADLEAVWRDPAMKALGYSGDFQGVRTYVSEIRKRLQTRWTFCGLFTKYPASHHASAPAPAIVMQAPYDGWGPTNIDRIFAHETGHVFGAPDEYRQSGCDCGGSHGFFGRPNLNCKNCAPGGSVECVMSANSWAMCSSTPWHLGFYWPSGSAINAVDATPTAPSAVVFKNMLYLFWKANHPSNPIYFSASSDGVSWSSGHPVNAVDFSPASPAAAVFLNRLCLFWKANDSSHAVLYSSSADGTSWPAGKTINTVDATPVAPAATVFKNWLYLFWKANLSSAILVNAVSPFAALSAFFAGTPLPSGKRINGTASTYDSPAATVFNGKLYLFWRSNDGYNSILYSASSDGVSWPAGRKVNFVDSTWAAPAAAVFNNRLYLFWAATDPENAIFYSASRDGISWPPGQRINEADRTPVQLAVAPFAGRLNAVWTADDPSHRILNSVLAL